MNSELYSLLSQKSKARKYLAEKNIFFFAVFYLSHHILDSLSELHQEWLSDLVSNISIAKAAPRSHAKTTIHSLVYPLWCILFQKKKFIILISDTADQSQTLLGTIIEELETNDKILKDFGKIAGYTPPTNEEKAKWTAKEIITLTGIKVIARGWKSKLRGLKHGANRPDLIILDDVENDENVQSEDQRAKVKNMFLKSILNLGDVSTQVVVVGTILHFDSLLMGLLMTPLPGWSTRLYRAFENDKPIWPERWSMERLAEKKAQIGSLAFEQEFMNNPLDPTTQILSPKEFYSGNIDLNEYDFYAYIDPAISEKETADFTAVVTVGRHKISGKIYVINTVRMKGKIQEQVELVFSEFMRYRHKNFGVESVAYQKALFQILAEESSKRRIYVPVIEIEVDKDKIRRANTIVPFIENGTIIFNSGHIDFLSEVQYFPKGLHDDYVDAFVGACSLALNASSAKGNVSSGRSIQYNN